MVDCMKYDQEIKKLKDEHPQYKDRIDKMLPFFDKIIQSEHPYLMANDIVSHLDAYDAYILGMICGEIIRLRRAKNNEM